MDGLTATQKIKTQWPNIKVVVYTMFPGYQAEAYRAGADYFLIKGQPGFHPITNHLIVLPLNRHAEFGFEYQILLSLIKISMMEE